MASIRVVKNVNPITIRIGQRTVKKVVASEKAATTTLATLQQLEQVQDIDITQRADNTNIKNVLSTLWDISIS